MKRTILALCLAFPMILKASGPSAEELALAKARNNGAQAKECLRVVDQDGMPVPDAKIEGGLQTGGGYNDYMPIQGATDTNGEFVVQGKCTNRIRCGITKDGYYASEFVLPNYAYRHSFKDGKWIPYGSQHTVALKKIIDPVNLSHPNPSRKENPDVSAWHGYDLEQCEWLPPYGCGRHADMLVRIITDYADSHDFKVSMEISFTNNPFAGAYLLRKDPYSEMKSIYRADTNAEYKASFEYLQEEHPIIHREPIVYVQGVNKTDTRLDRDSYLVFRTRTKVDQDGNLVSAHYGKIYGPWEIFRAMHAYGVYFNTKENDTNIEDIETAEHSRMLQRQREAPPYKKKRKSLWPF